MIVKNEEQCIKKSLASVVDFADEIVIGDTGSADRTPEIAKNLGARVFGIRWNDDFSEARNAVIDQARGEWILFIDADEKIRPCRKSDIWPAFSDSSKKAFFSYLIPHKNMTPRRTLRIFRRDRRIRYRGMIHETIRASLKKVGFEEGRGIGELSIFFDHFGHGRNRAQKHARNLPLLLKQLKRDRQNTYILRHLGLTYSKLNQRSLAEEAWTKAIVLVRRKKKKESADSLPFIDLVKSLQNREMPARNVLDEALDYFPDNPQLYFLNGRELLMERRPWNAVPYFQRLLRWGQEKDYDHSISYPQGIFDGYSFSLLASCYFLLGSFEKSAYFRKQALQYDLRGFRLSGSKSIRYSGHKSA